MNARDIVTSHLAEQARRFPDWINIPLPLHGLDQRDAALATAIEHAVMRRWLTLARVIESQLTRRWSEVEFRMQAVLLVGAAQLLLMERVPDHAIVHEAVEWAKANIRPKAGAMVNAVLRKVAGLRGEIMAKCAKPQAAENELPLGDGRVWRLTANVFDASPLPRLAQQTSHPDSLLLHWANVFDQSTAATLAMHSLVQSPIIVHGVKDVGANQNLSAHNEPGFHVYEGERAHLSQWLRDHRDAIVQDPTAAAVVNATATLQPKPQLIVDACAGMGTKTRQLAATHPDATIIAADLAEKRSDILREQFARHDRVRIVEHSDLLEFAGRVDLLLLDVPCSNSGVFARRVEAKYRLDRESLQSVVEVQRQIIADSLVLLAPRGRLVYSTCSIDPAENEQQMQWLCKWHPMTVQVQKKRLPRGVPGDPPQSYCDGGFYAIVEKMK